ncbi:MAG: hypothetical protein ACLFUF_05280 [Opitutales bacterium]
MSEFKAHRRNQNRFPDDDADEHDQRIRVIGWMHTSTPGDANTDTGLPAGGLNLFNIKRRLE